jgi:hypothetical protein
MHADLDTLCTFVYCTSDDLLPEKRKNARRRTTPHNLGVRIVVRLLALAACICLNHQLVLPPSPNYSSRGRSRPRSHAGLSVFPTSPTSSLSPPATSSMCNSPRRTLASLQGTTCHCPSIR